MADPDWDFSKYVTAAPSDSAADPLAPAPQLLGAGSGLASGSAHRSVVFGSESSVDSSDLTTGRPPVGWLVACLAVVLLGAAVALALGAVPTWAVAAWLLSGPVAIALLAAFTTFDTRARALAVYARRGWLKPLYVTCLVLCAVAVCISAVRIALWVGRL